MKYIKIEIILCVLILGSLSLALEPFSMAMTETMGTALSCGLVLLGAFLVGLVLSERPRDEREDLHRLTADRNAFLVGASVLTLAAAVQIWTHSVDLWLIGGLAAMILVKLASLLYTRARS